MGSLTSPTVGSIDGHTDSTDILDPLLAHQKLLISQQLLESLQWGGDCGGWLENIFMLRFLSERRGEAETRARQQIIILQ